MPVLEGECACAKKRTRLVPHVLFTTISENAVLSNGYITTSHTELLIKLCKGRGQLRIRTLNSIIELL